jgi:2-iminoacetate synthase
MADAAPVAWITETIIADALRQAEWEDGPRVRAILAKARGLKGLDLHDVAALSAVTAPDLLAEVFETARFVKDEIYGQRIVFFAPLYFSNICQNECTYTPLTPRAENPSAR